MRMWPVLLLSCGVLLLLSCSPMQESLEGLVAFDQVPAEYGQLISVTQHHSKPHWYELWFSNPETGVITYVPVYRTSWQYNPDHVKIVDRLPAASPGGAP